MAAPLIRSLFQPTDFDTFLDEIGLADLDGNDRAQLAETMKQSVEYGIVTKIFSTLPAGEKLTLVELMKEGDASGNDIKVNDWLRKKFPEIETLVDEVIENVKNQVRKMTSTLKHDIEQDLIMVRAMSQEKKAATEPPVPSSADDAGEREPFPWETATPAAGTPNISPTQTDTFSTESVDSPRPEPPPAAIASPPVDPLDEFVPPVRPTPSLDGQGNGVGPLPSPPSSV